MARLMVIPPRARLEILDGLASLPTIAIADAFRDLPGLAVLESARPGRRARWTFVSADPLEVLDRPAAAGAPMAGLRETLTRLAAAGPAAQRAAIATTTQPPAASPWPPFQGGLIGYLGYDAGHLIERLPTLAADDQGLPILRFGIHDWVVAIDRRGNRAWLAGRAFDGDERRLRRRLSDLRARLLALARRPPREEPRERTDGRVDGLAFTSRPDRAGFEERVRAIREAIAGGEIYQANLARRLEAPFSGDPWPLYLGLREVEPAPFSAYLDLGPSPTTGAPRAIVSASPEPFLTVDARGAVSTDPIKGTRLRGTDRVTDRALARELLESAKDRAENVMIVDVLRNDLGRVCRPGSIRVPRLCRLERTPSVQHLVSTVTGRLSPGRDALDLLAAAFPGGSITGAPKIRAMEILEGLEPVRRGPYTGALGWLGPDGAMGTSILIRTFVADGRLLTLHVGGGITRQSDPAAEYAETVAKARGPLSAICGREVG